MENMARQPRLESLVSSVVDVRPHEIPVLIHSFACFFFILSAYFVILPLRDDGAISLGLDNLPGLFVGSLVLTLVAAPVSTLMFSLPNLPKGRALVLIHRFFSITLCVFFILWYASSIHDTSSSASFQKSENANFVSDGGSNGDWSSHGWFYISVRIGLFLWVALLNLVTISSTWARIIDVMDTESGSRLFGFVGAGATLGQLFGSLFAVGMAWLGPYLLLCSAILMEFASISAKGINHYLHSDPSELILISEDAQNQHNKDDHSGTSLVKISPNSVHTHKAKYFVMLDGLWLILSSKYLLCISMFIWLSAVISSFFYFQMDNDMFAPQAPENLQNAAPNSRSQDPGWKYCDLPDPNRRDRVRCMFCEHISTGGIFRLKKHLAGRRGDVDPCPDVPVEVKREITEYLDKLAAKKAKKQQEMNEAREEVNIRGRSDDEDMVVLGGSQPKKPKVVGPINQFFNRDPEVVVRERLSSKQEEINMKLKKEERKKSVQFIARWFYQAVEWWTNHGYGTPYLQRMALRILNLTCTSSGCERNWSTFEMKMTIIALTISTPLGRRRMFAEINSFIAIFILVGQLTLTGRILTTAGITVAICSSPSVALFNLVALAMWPTWITVGISETIRKVVTYVITRPARELLFTVVSEDEKYKAKVCIDVIVQRLGDATAAGLYKLLFDRRDKNATFMSLYALPVCLLWIVTAIHLGRRHESLARLQNSLES